MYMPQQYMPTHAGEYVAVAETMETSTWGDKIYLFDFEHPSKAPKDFSFSRDFCEKHSVDTVDANSIVEVVVPPTLANNGSSALRTVPWVQLVIVQLDDGSVSKLWCPMHDGRGNRFLGNVQRMTDYVTALVDSNRAEIEPIVNKLEGLFEWARQLGFAE
jgi:hypothetical protein